MSTELNELRTRLQDAEETLRAIREGRVDALVVHEAQEEKIYTLSSADRPYRIMIEEMGQGAVTLASDGTILYCNRRFAAILERPVEEVLGTLAHAFVTPASRATFESILRQGETEGSGQVEVTLRSAGGTLVPAYVAATALSENEGAALCLIVTDLTEHKAAAEAAAANQAKDRFLANLSHELRTPLTPVLAVVSSLEEDRRLPVEVRSQISMMRRNLDLEARLIDDMLDLTRVARGKLELRRESVGLRQVLDHALQTTTHDLEAKQLRLATDLCAEDLHLWADTPRLTQVFWNLLHNAVKFTPEGGTITVRSWQEGGPEELAGWLVVEVADTGMGIEPDTLEHIFEAFDQGQPDTTRRFGGLGLGLAISKAIVEMHGGSLAAASSGRDQGATFTVRLPLPGSHLPLPAPSQPTAPAAATESSSSSRSLHLLLVEDHADTAEAMADLLRGLGYDVTVANSVAAGLAAAEAARADGIDLVVSDLGLPDGSGLDLMRELSSRYGLRGIALSGYGMEEDLRNSRAAGFERHLTKPVSLQDLEAALRELAPVIAGRPLP